MRKLAILLVVAGLLTGGCKVASGPFHAADGIVTCVGAATDAAGRGFDPLAHGVISRHVGTCGGEEVAGYHMGVKVRLYHLGDDGFYTLCGENDWNTVGLSTKVQVQTPINLGGPFVCNHPVGGERWQGRAQARFYYNGEWIESDWLKAPVEASTSTGSGGESESEIEFELTELK